MGTIKFCQSQKKLRSHSIWQFFSWCFFGGVGCQFFGGKFPSLPTVTSHVKASLVSVPSARLLWNRKIRRGGYFLISHSSIPLLFNSSSAFLRYFSLNQSSGVLTIRQKTPAGSYWLRISVSDGVWPDEISGVRVHVRDLEEKAILSSASLRLTGNTGRNTDSHDDIYTSV